MDCGYGMFGADSECSSRCESGWTVYLENSHIAPYNSCKTNKFLQGKANGEEEEEEEDLSMVSDASSGPPHILEEEQEYGKWFHHAHIDSALPKPKSNLKRQKKKEIIRLQKNLKENKPSSLDDTASSPIFNYCTNHNFTINNQASLENVVPDFSQGYSTTQFQGQSAYQEHCEFFQASLLPGNQLQQNQWFEGRRWG